MQRSNVKHGMQTNKQLTYLLALFILFITGNVLADKQSNEAIYIKADEMHFDLKSNSSIYKGHVTIKQNNMILNGDHVEVQQLNSIISTIIATGNPATFNQTNDNGNLLQAQSNHISYFADKGKLVMTGNAKLIQNEQIIESNHISYDTEKQALIAGEQSKQHNPKQRVKMTLTPDSKP